MPFSTSFPFKPSPSPVSPTSVLVSPSSSSSAAFLHSEEKDYFQVTDELAKENAHFRLSEAFLSIVERYHSNSCEQALEEMSPPPAAGEGVGGGGGGDFVDHPTALSQVGSLVSHSSSPGGGPGGGLYGTSVDSRGSSSPFGEGVCVCVCVCV